MTYEACRDNLTYEELASLFESTPGKIHTEVALVYNKIIEQLIVEKDVPIWDAVMGVKDFFGMSEREAVDKLNKTLRLKIKNYVKETYDIDG